MLLSLVSISRLNLTKIFIPYELVFLLVDSYLSLLEFQRPYEMRKHEQKCDGNRRETGTICLICAKGMIFKSFSVFMLKV